MEYACDLHVMSGENPMTKTDWTAEEVRNAIWKLQIGDILLPTKLVIGMLTAFAERIEADERAVPVAVVSGSDVVLGRESRSLHWLTKHPFAFVPGTKLFTHLPAQEQPGWKVPDSAWPKLELWFFRELTSAQRLALFALYGLPVYEIGENHVNQKRMLRYVIASPTPPKEK
jgi:hypothetical protein